MGGVVEQQIADAVTALEQRNETLARTVIGADLHVNAPRCISTKSAGASSRAGSRPRATCGWCSR